MYQWEKTPENKKLHAQGYIQAKYAVTMRWIQEMLPAGTHVEKAKGNRSQNYDYCTKVETRVAIGEEYGNFDPYPDPLAAMFYAINEALFNEMYSLSFTTQ